MKTNFLITTLLALTATSAFASGDMEYATLRCNSVNTPTDTGSTQVEIIEGGLAGLTKLEITNSNFGTVVSKESYIVRMLNTGVNHGMKLSYAGGNDTTNVGLTIDIMSPAVTDQGAEVYFGQLTTSGKMAHFIMQRKLLCQTLVMEQLY